MNDSSLKVVKLRREPWRKKRYLVPLTIFIVGFCLPNHWVIPVKDATKQDWHQSTFWYEPWGTSGTHKGIDIFAAKNQPVLIANHGILLFKGNLAKGGKVLIYLHPDWTLTYYAHLEDFSDNQPVVATSGSIVGTVGNSGNATDKPAHLHFSIISLLPRFWLIDSSTQGWKKMFYLNPNTILFDI